MNFYGCFPCATYEIKSNKIEGVFPSVVCVYPFFNFSRAAERWEVENRSEIVFRSYSIYGWCSFCGRNRTEKLKLKIPSEATDRERAENVGWEENCAKKIDSKSIWMVLSLLLLCSAFNFFWKSDEESLSHDCQMRDTFTSHVDFVYFILYICHFPSPILSLSVWRRLGIVAAIEDWRHSPSFVVWAKKWNWNFLRIKFHSLRNLIFPHSAARFFHYLTRIIFFILFVSLHGRWDRQNFDIGSERRLRRAKKKKNFHSQASHNIDRPNGSTLPLHIHQFISRKPTKSSTCQKKTSSPLPRRFAFLMRQVFTWKTKECFGAENIRIEHTLTLARASLRKKGSHLLVMRAKE